MDFISHGDATGSIPTVVEDESDKSSQNGHGMRIKKMSLILESPFTNSEKRRKFHNVNAFDPFLELDPTKTDDLENWLVNAPDRIALKVDIAERTIFVYDSMKTLTRFEKLQKIMRPIVKVIPRMMKESLLFGENYPQKQFL
ncbi:Hypothetical predicted protein [Olea europaea subsp. europaea]|uniref:Ubiquitin-like protease family profile domain-containing protein n=1 Tax=Olea europaea subsp. europaea TaxID=158383 RepID=A0A8S0USC3_OLEEU|nr:Hypothetical predicted protein [Olea europaea subsp. europaea]